MKKIMKAIFVLLLCIFVWQSMDWRENGGNGKAIAYGSLSKKEGMEDGRNKNVSFCVGHGKTNDICYISCRMEVRRGKGNQGERRVTVVHIVEK